MKNQDPKWGAMGGQAPGTPQFMLKQAKNLEQLRDALEGMVARKQAEVEALQEQLIRLKHGGGK